MGFNSGLEGLRFSYRNVNKPNTRQKEAGNVYLVYVQYKTTPLLRVDTKCGTLLGENNYSYRGSKTK